MPGVSMSVESVTETLTHMWDTGPDSDPATMGYRASQLNLILHFGLDTPVEEATGRFNTAVRFAQKYPCRIVVLCPSNDLHSEDEFEGKLYSQCFIGRELRDLCCCEALILGYSPEQSNFLENQVSTWLESDLPVYHWLHRVPVERISTHYRGFLRRCQKILFDGEIEGDSYDRIDWPHPARVKDLAFARNLPLRQGLGQFLSAYSRSDLSEGLVSLRFQYTPGMRRQAYNLLQWHRTALRGCFSKDEDFNKVAFTIEQLVQEHTGSCMRIDWKFLQRERYISWDYNESHKSGMIRSSLPGGSYEHPFHVEPLPPEKGLSEAMFF
ncbi:MAG: glucose-6-phosphate dehydrogenase assembly protein OpcA [Opitutales bacterium]